ncbi:hypothetical protein [[Mycoplasma] phocae]|nr:hypothetical protein [[Mycoplasma] phocae]
MKKKNLKWLISLPVAIAAIPLVALSCKTRKERLEDKIISDLEKLANLT